MLARLRELGLGSPWYIKMAAKLLLSRVPLSYRVWHRAGLFVHGAMDRPDYVVAVVRSHLEKAGWPEQLKPAYVALELGPGDSVASGMVTQALGASRTYLVDTGDYASRDMELYRRQAELLERSVGARPLALTEDTPFDEFLGAIHTSYLTRGIASLREVADQSVDFIWSHAVLEHVRREDFAPTIDECRRILAPGGICSHRVDLSDHLGGGLNNLRFSRKTWESSLMAGGGFYTNRIRCSEMLDIFRRAGFVVKTVRTDVWPRLPTPKMALAPEFSRLSDDELLVRGFDVVLT